MLAEIGFLNLDRTCVTFYQAIFANFFMLVSLRNSVFDSTLIVAFD